MCDLYASAWFKSLQNKYTHNLAKYCGGNLNVVYGLGTHF